MPREPKSGKKLLGEVLLLLLFACLVAGGATLKVRSDIETLWNASGPAREERWVQIPQGTPLNEVALLLAYAGALKEPEIFSLIVRLDGKASVIKAGEYRLPPQASMAEILRILEQGQASGKIIQHRIVIPEGLTTRQVLARVASDPNLEGEITLAFAEGALLPETYFFPRGTTRDQVLNRMQESMQETLAELWQGRADNLPLANPQEAVILASIIESETGLASERAQVASVFINRLRRGVRLQSDPTVSYAITQGQFILDRALTRDDLALDHPYNTYRIAGLPPGAIVNPGRAAVQAALQPAETDYYYFVADGEGGHRFASNLIDHNRNVAAYRAALEAEKRSAASRTQAVAQERATEALREAVERSEQDRTSP